MQYSKLLAVDNIALTFDDSAIEAMADIAVCENETNEDIGARRLYAVVEKVIEDLSFNANGEHPLINVVIDEKYVKEHVDYSAVHDLKKYIL